MTKSRKKISYRHAVEAVRYVGMDVEDGLAFTFACADYPAWIRDMNGWPVEDAAEKIAAHSGSEGTGNGRRG